MYSGTESLEAVKKSEQVDEGLTPLMALQAKQNVESFLVEILFYHMLKDQGAKGYEAKAFFDQLRKVPALKVRDPFISQKEALPFIATMDVHMRTVRDRVAKWLEADESLEVLNEAEKPQKENQTQQKDTDNELGPDPTFEDVQNFVADELEDLIDSPTLKDKIKGVLGHDD